MDTKTLLPLLVAAGGVWVVMWLLHKLGKALATILEALATVAAVLMTVWLAVKALCWLIKTAVVHWRTTLSLGAVGAWLLLLGRLSLAIITAVAAVGLIVWRWRHRVSFDRWAGRRLRAWWLRWTIYARKLPTWLQACGLTIRDTDRPVVVTMNPLGRNKDKIFWETKQG